jgi:hypothetical protein
MWKCGEEEVVVGRQILTISLEEEEEEEVIAQD